MHANTLHRRHEMPFGAQALHNGKIRFRLWAPKAKQVELCLADEDRELSLEMELSADGWYELTTALAQAGSLYRYRIDGSTFIPDPASRYQIEDVHGYSVVVDAESWQWQDAGWTGKPWEEAIIYELHVGTFTPEGNYKAITKKLDYLLSLGITAIELMPIAEFPGLRNWGYDGVLAFAPSNNYGSPEELKELIQTAHTKGMMVFLDVVYNHFGPEGNYLHQYAPAFFNERYHTPWGAAINYDGEDSTWIRQFFIHNALYWLEEYHFDGLRLDAVHAIFDAKQPDILEELAETIRRHFEHRQVHLVLENDHNAARYLHRDSAGKALHYVAQWNDDIHHALHVLLTGETQGYYIDYANQPLLHVGRCLLEGFAYQGEHSIYRNGASRGEASGDLSPLAFVSFLQNHDQIGNRALAERISILASERAIRTVTALLLLAPFPPLLFMGQEWGSRQPFHFFCDFEPALGKRVTEGRRTEFARYFGCNETSPLLPDPSAENTFRSSMLDWESVDTDQGSRWLEFHKTLLSIRRQEVQPRLAGIQGGHTILNLLSSFALNVAWRLGDGSHLHLTANLGPESIPFRDKPPGRSLYALPEALNLEEDAIPGWSLIWTLQEQHER